MFFIIVHVLMLLCCALSPKEAIHNALQSAMLAADNNTQPPVHYC